MSRSGDDGETAMHSLSCFQQSWLCSTCGMQRLVCLDPSVGATGVYAVHRVEGHRTSTLLITTELLPRPFSLKLW